MKDSAQAVAQQALDAGMSVLVLRFVEQQPKVHPRVVAATDVTNSIQAVEKLGWRLEHFNSLKASGNQWAHVAVFRRSG